MAGVAGFADMAGEVDVGIELVNYFTIEFRYEVELKLPPQLWQNVASSALTCSNAI